MQTKINEIIANQSDNNYKFVYRDLKYSTKDHYNYFIKNLDS